MFALMLTLPATLLGLVVLLVVTSQLERQLSRTVRAAEVRPSTPRLRVSSSQQH